MNIFVLDTDPVACAKYHCDKHVVKMILEHAQMFSTNCRLAGFDEGYKVTHPNHPCTIWLRESLGNAVWLYEMTAALNNEYKVRYGHAVNHKSWEVIETLPIFDIPYPAIAKTPFVKAMKQFPDCEQFSNPVEAYRQLYVRHKKDFCTWKNGNIPNWFKHEQS